MPSELPLSNHLPPLEVWTAGLAGFVVSTMAFEPTWVDLTRFETLRLNSAKFDFQTAFTRCRHNLKMIENSKATNSVQSLSLVLKTLKSFHYSRVFTRCHFQNVPVRVPFSNLPFSKCAGKNGPFSRGKGGLSVTFFTVFKMSCERSLTVSDSLKLQCLQRTLGKLPFKTVLGDFFFKYVLIFI